MERKDLPFAYEPAELSRELIARLGYNGLSSEDLAEWYTKHQTHNHKPEHLLHFAEFDGHGGSIRLLASLVAAEYPFLHELPDEAVRLSLYNASEFSISTGKQLRAKAELGLLNHAHMNDVMAIAEDVTAELERFQKRLLERVTPSDPMTRK